MASHERDARAYMEIFALRFDIAGTCP